MKPEDSSHLGVTSKSNNNNRAVLALITGLVTITSDLAHRIQGIACPAKRSLLDKGSCRYRVAERIGGEKEKEGEEELSELFSQLYQSSQASELDKVYFDMKDVLSEEVGGHGGLSGNTSILMEQVSENRETQDSGDLVASMETSSNSQQRSISMSLEQSQLSSQMSTASSSCLFSQQRYLSLSSHPHAVPTVHRPRLILCGAEGMGQSSLLSPALLHALEEFPVKTLDLTTVFATSTKTPEEACTQVRTLSDSVVGLLTD